MTNATVFSYPAPAGELLALDSRERGMTRYNENAKWYVKIHWVMSDYDEWLPVELVREEYDRQGRKRTPRRAVGSTSDAKRNDLLRQSAPKKLGSKKRPIKVDEDDDGGSGTKVTRNKRKSASGSRACSRTAAVAGARAAKLKTGGPKRLKKEKSLPKANNDLLPDITVGTKILKHFTEGCKGKGHYQGEITKLPGPGNSFYHVRYDDDGDEEDLEPHEMWIAFSDWFVVNEGITLPEVRRTPLHACM